MIVDIPTPDDFRNTGVALLNLAWESVLAISLHLASAPVEEWGDSGDVEAAELWRATVDRYWQSTQQELATAVALAQQGTEFLLKSKIAAVSPFILLAGNPSDWPGGCDQNDTPFADFKTIDAQDLPRAHDAVSTPSLPAAFRVRFEQLRRMRNSVMHTVDRRLRFSTQDGIMAVLEVAEALLGAQSWIALRKAYLQRQPDLVPHPDEDHRRCQLAQEIVHVIDSLKPADARRFFGFEKRQRRYLCPGCENECANWQLSITAAQLRPNTPESTTVGCICCGNSFAVVRQACNNGGCRGNVISLEYGMCLTCGRQLENEEPRDGGQEPGPDPLESAQ